MDKPPLGARPAFITSRDRIRELGEAIVRFAENPSGDVEKIRLYATEICSHCDIIQLERNDLKRTNVDK